MGTEYKTTIEAYCLVKAIKSASLADDRETQGQVLAGLPPAGTKCIIIERRSSEHAARVFVGVLTRVIENRESAGVEFQDIYRLTIVNDHLVTDKKPYDGMIDGFLDNIGYRGGGGERSVWVVAYEQGRFVASEILHQQRLVASLKVEIQHLKDALGHASCPDNVRALADAITPGVLAKLLELKRELDASNSKG